MTNEEKARLIAEQWGNGGVYTQSKISALEMAKWKDQQIQEIIDKEIDRANRYHDNKLSRTQISASVRVVGILSEYLGKEFPEDRFHFGFATID